MNTRDLRENPSDGRSNQECSSKCSTHHSHIFHPICWTRYVGDIGLYHSESCASESSDESCHKKEYKKWSESEENIFQMRKRNRRCFCDYICSSSCSMKSQSPDTRKHDKITNEIDNTCICEHLFATVCIRKSTEKESTNKHTNRINSLCISSP